MDMFLDIVDYQHPFWRVVGPGVLPILAIVIAWPPLRKIFRHVQLQKYIRRMGQGHLSQVRISIEQDEVYVEHLILQPDGLLLLMVRPYRGNIFAAEKIDMWTQVLGHHSYKFPNPLYELERDTQTLRAMIDGMPVKGMVIFGQGSSFPKGKPARVYDFSMLREEAGKTVTSPINEKLRSAWSRLQEHAAPTRHLQHAVLYQRGDKRRLVLGTLLLLAALLIGVWQLGWIDTGRF